MKKAELKKIVETVGSAEYTRNGIATFVESILEARKASGANEWDLAILYGGVCFYMNLLNDYFDSIGLKADNVGIYSADVEKVKGIMKKDGFSTEELFEMACYAYAVID